MRFLDFKFCVSDHAPLVIKAPSNASVADVNAGLKGVSVTGHRCFLDCIKILAGDDDSVEDLFVKPSEEIFKSLGYFRHPLPQCGLFRNTTAAGENSRSAVIQTVLQRSFVSYEGKEFYWYRELNDVTGAQTDIFLYLRFPNVIPTKDFFFSITHSPCRLVGFLCVCSKLG